jgi:outer membrane protein OmpA-like peptidoglycan-associated protein
MFASLSGVPATAWMVVACLGMLAPSAARAEVDARLHGSIAGLKAIGGYQKDEFAFGVHGTGQVEFIVLPELGIQLDVGGMWLGKGDPSTQGYAVDTSWAFRAGPSLRVHPFARSYDGSSKLHAAGLWAAAGGGLVLTGELARGGLHFALGWDVLLAEGRFGIGPTIGYDHIFQTNDSVRPDDGNLLNFGVHVVFGGRRGKPDEAAHVDDRPDRDLDEILDVDDKCPDEREDLDDFQDEDGCPEPDNDRDGILDLPDLCPNEPETFNDYADGDGCPDDAQVRVVGNKIVTDETVLFIKEESTLLKESRALLDRVATLLLAHPEYAQVSVEGHTDERGEDAYNQRLSIARAKAVMDYLISKGVPHARLSHTGFGASRPVVDRSDPRAYLLNRRVEFRITRAGDQAPDRAPTGPESATPPPSPVQPPATPQSTGAQP